MKTKSLFFLLAGFLMYSCSSDDNPMDSQQSEGQQLVFEISAKSGMQLSKSASPIYSQEATQKVTRVSVYAFKKDAQNDYLFEKTFDVGNDWQLGTTEVDYAVPEGEMLTEGSYKFIALGRPATDLYTIPDPSGVKFEEMVASITAAGNEYELFAGSAGADVYSAGARVSIEMTRKVAGVLAYFKNVPAEKGGEKVKYLRLSVTTANTHVNLTTGAGSIANASVPYSIVNIDLSGQTVSGGIYVGNDLSSVNVVRLDNSQLDGAYMLPATGVEMTLGLYGEDGLTPLQVWQVTNSGGTTFDLVANNFYSLGQKTDAGSTNGGTDGDPDDDDTAIDLLTDQVIEISIDPNWAVIHKLGIQ